MGISPPRADMDDFDSRRVNSWPTTLVDEERKIQRGSRLGWSQQPRDRSGPQTDRPKLWLQCQYQCGRTGGRNWRLHHAGGRTGVLREGHYARLVQQYSFRFGHPECAPGWRPHNTIALRIYGRGTYFLAYLEYGTGLWRAGGTSFGGEAAIPTGVTDYPFSFTYDPNGADGQGTVTATLGSYSAMLTLDAGHQADGAIFNRFGILSVMKSADDPGQLWLDNVTINGVTHPFNSNPLWNELNNRRTYTSTNVRPRFNFGYSPG